MTSIALITGASRGIGLATAKQLGSTGVTTLVGARGRDKGRRAVEELQSDDVDADFLDLDVTDESTISRARDHIEERYGRLDILINNAGVLPEAVADSPVVPLQ